MILRQQIISECSEIPQNEVNALLRFFPQGIAAFDVETTGLSPLQDRIIELSAIKVKPNRGIRIFSKLINPGKPIPMNTQEIHHISDEMVAECPPIEEVLPEFLEFNGPTALIGHNAKFDAGFLASAMHFTNTEFYKIPIYCSLQIAKDAFKKMSSFKLGSLAKELDLNMENHHRALDDSIACLRLFAKALIALQQKNNSHLVKKSYLFSMKDFDRKNEFDLPEKFKEFKYSIRLQEELEIKYKGGSHRGIFRPIKPLAFLPMPQGAVLYALCLLSNQHKSFKLTKISSIRQKLKKELE